MVENQEYFSPGELAEYLNVSKKFIDKHIATKRLPGAVRVGRLWRFKKIDIEKRLAIGELLLPEKA